jgi:uncharacterized protein (TIGR03435 family)
LSRRPDTLLREEIGLGKRLRRRGDFSESDNCAGNGVSVITRSAAGAVLAIFVSGASLVGQPGVPPEFEVASVKPTKAGLFDVNTHLPSLNVEPGRTLNFANTTLKDLIMLAYGAGAAQVSGPDWLVNRFDIVAKIPSGAAKERIPMMLQTLLAQRFKLALHRERKNISVYALEISGGGAKLQESVVRASVEAGCTRSYAQSPEASFAAVCHRMTSASLAQAVQTMAPNYFDRPVVDMTGLKGVYDLTLEWISFSESTNGDTGPTIFDAILRLGLKLEARRHPMDIFVIDHCEKEPTEN